MRISDRFCGIFCLAFLLLARGQFNIFLLQYGFICIVVIYARVRIGCPGSCLIFEGHFRRVSGFWVLRHIQLDSSLHWHPLPWEWFCDHGLQKDRLVDSKRPRKTAVCWVCKGSQPQIRLIRRSRACQALHFFL